MIAAPADYSVVLFFRGNLKDTARLVGLVNTRALIKHVVYDGDGSFSSRRYCGIVSQWMKNKGYAGIVSPKNLHLGDLVPVAMDPIDEWRWGEDECVAAIRLAGLPLPPNYS